MKEIELISQNSESTVVAEFEPTSRKSEQYQTEASLEKEFIEELQKQGYEYLTIKTENDLKNNLRNQIEKLNNIKFSEGEWKKFFETEIANQNAGIEEKTRTIQEDNIKNLYNENGEFVKNIKLIDKENIHNNFLQVINQYSTESGEHSNRYDVTILVNGLPLIHIELKRRWIALKEAFNQIDRYQRESFWADCGLFEYVQLFVISNGTHTKYYSNTTRFSHIKEKNNSKMQKKKTSNSFEFTSWWASANNKPIEDLMDFTKTFFAKHTILNILTKYSVFTSEKMLLVMRPYQIVATEKILQKITISHNYKKYWKVEAGGYVWHTTGSGKTLTSFKTSILASKLDFIDKVLFVVDRKDLDYQTMKEYDKFEKWAANSNANTATLKKQLENPKDKIIITTIQKLDNFVKKYGWHEIFSGEVVMIFDECHRSQFGDMHKNITKAFKKYYIFGFTGTPIKPKNSTSNAYVNQKTTAQIFGTELHSYTIVNAIADKNVLPFRIDYISTFKKEENLSDEKIANIDREKVLADPRRLENIVKYILENFDKKTYRSESYKIKDKRLKWFNSMFAVSSIEMAKKYYFEFKKQQENVISDKKLKIATIFSFAQNEAEEDFMDDENPENIDGLDMNSREFLESAIADYNAIFGMNFDTSSEGFQGYYKDLSQKVKNREIDILIVVNMFLTGFDATTLNTLWVDKNLQYHWLIQAFSRTNRILNSVKQFGNVICFRNLEKQTNDALAMFWNEKNSATVILKNFSDYYFGYNDGEKNILGYKNLIENLENNFPIGARIDSENEQKEFIKLYSKILRLRNILQVFDDFSGKKILSERDFQDYHSMYIDLYNEFRKVQKTEKTTINDDLIFEMELIKQVEINIDYILELVKKFGPDQDKNQEITADIRKAVNSSMELRNKKDLIEEFIKNIDISASVDDTWQNFVEKKRMEEIEKIILEENLNREKTFDFIEKSFKVGQILENGTDISNILPKISRFKQTENENRAEKKKSVLEKLKAFFEKFFDISVKERI